jgi:hypothetical protein
VTVPTRHLLGLLTAAIALGSGMGDASLEPEPPLYPRPRRDVGCGYPAPRREPPPREPTRDELRAMEKRKRKAAKRQKGQ